MGKARRCTLSEQQDDVVQLWTPVTLVPGDNQCAKVVFTRSDDTTKDAEQRSLCEESASHDSGCLPKSNITNLQKRLLVLKKSTHSRSPCSYNLRASAGCTYVDTDMLDTDDMTYCRQCEKEYVGVCSLHFMLVLNKQVPRDGSVRERARLTVPWPLFISNSKIEDAGEGVWTSASLPQGLVFGPYEGHIFRYVPRGAESGYAWRLKSSKCCLMLVDSFKKSASNWLRYVNCARTPSEVNLDAFQYKGNIYYVTCCDIKSNTELLVWYGEEYGKELGLSSHCYNGISVPDAQEETHHLQDIPTLNGLLTETDRASRMKSGKPKVPDKGLSVTDTTLSLTKNNSQDDIKKLSKSQSELEHLFITARLKPGKNDSAEVQYILPENIKTDEDETDDNTGTRQNLWKMKLASILSSVRLVSKYDRNSHAYCVECKKTYRGMCTKHLMTLILDTPVSRDGSVKDRARITAPWPLYVEKSKVIGAGDGIWTSATLPKGLVFGPCEGHIVKDNQKISGYGWKIHGRPDIDIDAEDTSVSNWARYINCARNYTERNIIAMQIQNEIFYVTNCIIKSGTELMVWYGAAYGRLLGISLRDFFKPQLKELDLQRWCSECHILFTSRKYLLQHQANCKKSTSMIVQGNDNMGPSATREKHDRQQGRQVKRKYDTERVETGMEENIKMTTHQRMKTSPHSQIEGLTKCSSQNTKIRSPSYSSIIKGKSSNHDRKLKGSSDYCVTSNRSSEYDAHYNLTQDLSVTSSRSSDHDDAGPINASDGTGPNRTSFYQDSSTSKPFDCNNHHINSSLHHASFNRSFDCGNSSKRSSVHGKSPSRSFDHCFSPKRSCDYASNSWGTSNKFSDHDGNASCLNDHGASPSNSFALDDSCSRPSDQVASPSSPSYHDSFNKASNIGGSSSSSCGASPSRSSYDADFLYRLSGHVANSNKSFDHGTCSNSSSYHVTSPNMASDHVTSPEVASDHVTSPNMASDHVDSPNMASDHVISSNMASYGTNPKNFSDDDPSHHKSFSHDTSLTRTSDFGTIPNSGSGHVTRSNRPFGYDASPSSSSDHVANYANPLYYGASPNNSIDHDAIPKTSLGYDSCLNVFSNHNASPSRPDQEVSASKSFDQGAIANVSTDQGAIFIASSQQDVSPKGFSDQEIYPSSSFDQRVSHTGSHDYRVSSSVSSEQGVGLNRPSDKRVSPSRYSAQGLSPSRCYDHDYFKRSSVHSNGTSRISDYGACSNISVEFPVSPRRPSDQGISPSVSSDHVTSPDVASDHVDNPNMATDYVISSNMASYGTNPHNFLDDDPSYHKSFSHDTSLSRTSDYGIIPNGGSGHVTRSNRPFGYDASPSSSSDHVANYANPLYHGASPNNSIDHDAIPKTPLGYDSCLNVFSNHNASPSRPDQEVRASKSFDQGAIANVSTDQGAIFILSSQQDISPKGFFDQEIYPSRSFDQRVSHTGSHDYRVSFSVSSEQGVGLNRPSDERVSPSRYSAQGLSPSRCYDHDYFKRSSVHSNGTSRISDYGACSNISVEFPVSPRRPSDQGISPSVQVIPSRPDLETRLPDQDYFSRFSDHSIGPSMFGVHDVSANISFQYHFSPSRCSDDAFLIKSTDNGVSLNNSSDWVFSSNRLSDMGVSHKRSSDQGMSPFVSSDQEVSPNRSRDYEYFNRSLDHGICQSNSLNHSVNPNLPNESDVSLNKFSDCGVSHNRSHDPCVSHSGLNDFRSSPGKPDEFCVSPSKSSDCDVSPKRTCDGDMSPNSFSDRDVRHKSENEISSCCPFNHVSSSSSLDNNLNPKKSPDLFWTLNRSSHHTVCGSRFTNHGDTLNKSSDPSSSSKWSSECVNLCTSSDLGVTLTRYPDHGVYPQIPTVLVGSRNSSSPKISLASSSDLCVSTYSSPVYSLSHNYDVSYCSMTPTNSGHLEKPSGFSDHVVSPIMSSGHTVSSNKSSGSRSLDDAFSPHKSSKPSGFSDHVVSPIRSSGHTVSSNKSSGSRSLDDAFSPHKSSCHVVCPKRSSYHIVISNKSSCSVHPRASLGHVSPSRFSDDVIPRRFSTRAVSPSMYPDNPGCWLSDDLFSGPAGRPSRSADNAVRPRWSSDHIVHPSMSSDKMVYVNESSDVSTNYYNAIRGMSCCRKVSPSKSSDQSPHLSKFSDQCGSLNMPCCNNSSPAYFSHHRANPGSSFHSAIPGRLSDSNISPNESSCHSDSSVKTQNRCIYYVKPINHNSSGNETRSMQSLNVSRDEDVSDGSTSSTKESFSCDSVDSSVDNISIVATEPMISTQPSQNEQVHLFNYRSKYGKKKSQKDCYMQEYVANQGCTKKEGLGGCGLYSSKHSTKENKPYSVYDPQSVNRQYCDYDKAHLREGRAKSNTIGQLLGKKLQDFTTYQSTGGQSFSSAKRKVAHFSHHKNPYINNSHCQQCAVSDHGVVNEPFVEGLCNANAISHDSSVNYCVQSLNCLIYSEKSKSKENFHTRVQDQDFGQAGSSHVDRHRSEWRKTCNVAKMQECKIEQEVTASPKSHCTSLKFVRAVESSARTHPYMNPKKGSTSELRSNRFLVEITNISFGCSKCGQKFLNKYNHNLHVALLHPL